MLRSVLLLSAAVLLAIPMAATAASITFSQTFNLPTKDVVVSSEGEHGLTSGETGWLAPAFNPALGTPEVLLLSFEGEATIKGTAAGSEEILVVWDIYAHFDGERIAGPRAFAECNEPCTFETTESIAYEFFKLYAVGDPQFDWLIGYSPDKFVRLDGGASAEIETLLSGTASATYFYEPFAVPEPATMVLIGTGIAAALIRSRRRRVD